MSESEALQGVKHDLLRMLLIFCFFSIPPPNSLPCGGKLRGLNWSMGGPLSIQLPSNRPQFLSSNSLKPHHWDHLVKFLQELERLCERPYECCASISPANPIQYYKVHTLLLNWALDDLGTDVELQDLGTQLRSQF